MPDIFKKILKIPKNPVTVDSVQWENCMDEIVKEHNHRL